MPSTAGAGRVSEPISSGRSGAATESSVDRARRRYPTGPYTGVAVPRGSVPPAVHHPIYTPGWSWWDYNYYRPNYWYWAPVGWGLGYWSYYDPWWGYGGPYWYGGAYSSGYAGYDLGAVRLKVKPRHAQVFVDGYYVGLVDEFDGVFQRMRLDEGPHRIEVRLDGFAPMEFKVYVTPDRTLTLNGVLQPIP